MKCVRDGCEAGVLSGKTYCAAHDEGGFGARWFFRGEHVRVSSTRKDKDCEGEIVSSDDVTIMIQLANGARRKYPWAQVAYVEVLPKDAVTPDEIGQ